MRKKPQSCEEVDHKWVVKVAPAEYEPTLAVWIDKQRQRTCEICGEERLGVDKANELHQAIAVAIAESARPVGVNEMRWCRSVLGLRASGLAKQIGVTRGTVSRWESGALQIAASAQIAIKLLVLLRFGRPYRVVQVDGQRGLIYMRLVGGNWYADDPDEIEQRLSA